MVRSSRVSLALVISLVLSGSAAFLLAAAPVADAGADQVDVPVGDTVGLDGTASSDPDGDPLTYAWKFLARPAGSAAALSSATSPTPTFVADRNGVYQLQLAVKAGGQTAFDTMTVTTLNHAPIANAGADAAVKIGKSVRLVGTASSDPDGDKLAFSWTLVTRPAASAAAVVNANKASATLKLDRPGTYVAELTVVDPFGLSDTDAVEINHVNTAPLSSAGVDQAVAVGALVTLDASASSDVDDDGLTYTWTLTRPAGSAAVLSDATDLQPTFVADVAGSYSATVVAHDGTVAGRGDRTVVTAGAANAQPAANAGADQRISVGQTVYLDGSRSTDPNGQALSHAWTLTRRPTGSAAVLSDPTAVRPSFNADRAGSYTATLVVTDTAGRSSLPDAVLATTLNVAPVANAGLDQVAAVGTPVRLRGNGSTDVNGQALTYGWALLHKPEGSAAVLTSDTVTPLSPILELVGADPFFTPDVLGRYQFQLIVNDGVVNSLADTVVITTGNVRPHANAGPDQAVTVGEPVSLDGGTSSDANGDPLTFAWTLSARPAGSAASLSGSGTATPSFTADVAGTYVAQLRISDGVLTSAPDTIVVTTGNAFPAANAGADQAVPIGAAVGLDGTASTDANADALTYRWAMLARPAGSTATLTNPATATPSFTADLGGTYIAQLIVHDGTAASEPVTVTVSAADDVPLPVVTVTASDGNAAEAGSEGGTFTFMRTGPTSATLDVFYGAGGSASNGVDYDPALTGSLVFPVGVASVDVAITPVDDAAAEGDESVLVALAANAAYDIGAPDSATVIIADNDLPTVTVTAADASASEAGPDPGTFRMARTGSTTSPLTVRYAVSGSASSGDFDALSGVVVIPAGASFATTTVTPVDDSDVEGSETVILGLSPDAAYVVGAPDNATVTILDNDLPVVTAMATDAAAAESGPENGTLTFIRTGSTVAALQVFYTASGTASGGDYTALSGSVTIPANESSADVTVTPVDDALFEGDETVVLTVDANAAYTVGSPNSASVTIADNDVPTVTVSASDNAAHEAGPEAGTFTFARSGITTQPLDVSYTLSGTADSFDYGALSGTVTIAAGQASASVELVPVDDAAFEGPETVIATIAADADYTVGNPASATITIGDNDRPIVTVIALDADAWEFGPDAGTFRFDRSGSTAAPLTVTMTIGGNATNGTDYQTTAAEVIFSAGQSVADVVITPIPDTQPEGVESINVTIVDGPEYDPGSPASAVISIADSSPNVTVQATDSSAGEDGPDTGTFTFTRSDGTGDLSAPLMVHFTVGGTASSGSDYIPIGTSVTIAANQASATVTLTPIADGDPEGSESVIVSLAPGAYNAVGGPATVTIFNSNLPVVTVLAIDADASEPGLDPGTFRFARTGATAESLFVTYSVAGTAINGTDYQAVSTSVVFGAGQSTVDRQLTPFNDAQVEGPETVVFTIVDGAAYNIGAPGSNTATVTIADQPTPVITVETIDGEAAEPGLDPGTFRFSRAGDTAFSLAVTYAIAGTAINGTDYQAISTTIAFAAGESTVDRQISPFNDAIIEGPETVTLTLADGAQYDLGAPAEQTATVTIADQPTPVITLAALDAAGSEPGADPATFRFTRAGDAAFSLSVSYTVGGTAINGTDYQAIGTTIAFPAGASTVDRQIAPFNDALVEGPETVVLTLTDGAQYDLGAPSTQTATVTIADQPTPVVTLETIDADAAEPGLDRGLFRFARAGDTAFSLTVSFTVSGTAINGTDYQTFGTTIAFPAGESTVDRPIVPFNDATVEGPETVTLTLADGSQYDLDAPSTQSGTVTIADQPTPVITLEAVDPDAAESGPDQGTFRFTRAGDTAFSLTVSFAVSGTAINGTDYQATGTTIAFPAGASTVDRQINPFNDALVEGPETVTFTVTDGAQYDLGAPGSTAATVTIADQPTPVITVEAFDATASEAGLEPGTLRFTRAGDTTFVLTVSFAVGGSAINGTDYQTFGTTIAFPAGAATVDRQVTPFNDTQVEGPETVTVTLADGAHYDLGAPGTETATVTIDDDDPAP